MTILEQTRSFYNVNFSTLKTFLENLVFLDTNLKYPKSIVIRFGLDKLIGEISVWENETESYLELEYANLQKPNQEMVNKVVIVTNENIIEILSEQFEVLSKIFN